MAETEQESLWLSLWGTPEWELIRSYLEEQKARICVELCTARSDDHRATLQGQMQMILGLLNKQESDEAYEKILEQQREMMESDDESARTTSRGIPGLRPSTRNRR